jgi:hypothetical protein
MWTEYWAQARHTYFRDHAISGAWGVRDNHSGRVFAVGMDKTYAAAFACLLNGDIEHAKALLQYNAPVPDHRQ